MTASAKDYLRCTAALKVKLLSPESLAKLNALEAAEDYDNPGYERIMMETLYPQMICRMQPWPEPVQRAFRSVNTKIYEQMQGKSEFLVTGNLKDWDRWDRLHEIKVRTLTLGGAYDEMDPEDMKMMATLMPNGTNATCPNGSHLCMWDGRPSELL
jgi:proline iminopeptidase